MSMIGASLLWVIGSASTPVQTEDWNGFARFL
jgi:hypothetical protein